MIALKIFLTAVAAVCFCVRVANNEFDFDARSRWSNAAGVFGAITIGSGLWFVWSL